MGMLQATQWTPINDGDMTGRFSADASPRSATLGSPHRHLGTLDPMQLPNECRDSGLFYSETPFPGETPRRPQALLFLLYVWDKMESQS